MNARANGQSGKHAGREPAKAFAPLAPTSQMMRGTSVMYFDATMPGREIHEQAQYRIGVAQRLLESYAASSFKDEDEDLGQTIAAVSALMISDAMALVDEMGRRVSCQPDPLIGNGGGDVVVPIHGKQP